MKPGRNVLIIDDSELICQTFSYLVAKAGHAPFCASTLNDGMQKLRSGAQFDLVFLDVRLPDANGLEHISEILKSPSTPEVIIITAFGSQEVADFALRSGALDFIDKPSSPEVIILRTLRALEHYRTKMFWLKVKQAFEGGEE
jgi:two-component system NtrC family response regulator